MLENLNPVWNLETIFPGGSSSPELKEEMEKLAAELKQFDQGLNKNPPLSLEDWLECLNQVQAIGARLREAGAFLGCLNAANTNDIQAQMLSGAFFPIFAGFDQIRTKIMVFLSQMDQEAFNNLIAAPQLQEYNFVIKEMRSLSKQRLPLEQEQLISNLSINGLNAWGTLYQRLVSRVKIELVEKDGSISELSAGQAYNRLSDPDRSIREQLMPKWEEAWSDLAEIAAHELNSLIGFRLEVYKARGWSDPLTQALQQNRIERKTIETMWSTIDKNKDALLDYLNAKKKLLGVEELSWHDFSAPVGNQDEAWTYTQGANFIIEQFQRFSPKMAEFAQHAFENRWVEAENRSGKGVGAFCTTLPVSKETRIFTTFSGTINNVTTLAHELGHGFHAYAMKDMSLINQEIGMCLAETASTFSELVVSDAAIKSAQNDQEKLSLLEDKMQRAANHMMNIHSRFIFETKYYAARQKAPLSLQQINEMMVEAQKEAYCDALGEWHPTFWFSKGHFHGTSVPFYNFPYTFGFLFATGVYAKAQEMGDDFEDMYVELLQNTGVMTVEELAKAYLDVDLREEEFWQRAIDLALNDLDEYLRLAEKFS